MANITGSKGDIFKHMAEPGAALVIPENAAGELGKNLSAQLSARHPGFFKWYASLGLQGQLKVGHVYPAAQALDKSLKRFVTYLFAVTQPSMTEGSTVEMIDDCLTNAVLALTLDEAVLLFNVTHLYVPALGCGMGGLQWADVKGSFRKILVESPIDVTIFAP